jgi:hypothetical protein
MYSLCCQSTVSQDTSVFSVSRSRNVRRRDDCCSAASSNSFSCNFSINFFGVTLNYIWGVKISPSLVQYNIQKQTFNLPTCCKCLKPVFLNQLVVWLTTFAMVKPSSSFFYKNLTVFRNCLLITSSHVMNQEWCQSTGLCLLSFTSDLMVGWVGYEVFTDSY